MIKNAESDTQANIYTDHFPVIADIKVNLKKKELEKRRKKQIPTMHSTTKRNTE